MGIWEELNKVRRAMSSQQGSFELVDGSKYFVTQEAGAALFDYAAQCARADYYRQPQPPTPEPFRVIPRAKKRVEAVKLLYPDWPKEPRQFTSFALATLTQEGGLEHQRFAPSYDPIPPIEES